MASLGEGGGEAFNDDVGAGHELPEQFPAGGGLEIAGDAALVDVAGQPGEAALRTRLVAGERRQPAGGIALRRLDFDDVGAQIG